MLFVGVIAEFDECIRGMAESIALLDASSRRSWLLVPSGRAESAAYYHTRSQKDGQSNLEVSLIFEASAIIT